MEKTRREFLRDAALAGAGITSTSFESKLFADAAPAEETGSSQVASPQKVALSWLGEKLPNAPTGVSWGVPWVRGAVSKDVQFQLSGGGKNLPLQSWPLAYWPDGSLKWSGFATVVPAGFDGHATLETNSSATTSTTPGPVPLTVKNDGTTIRVDTGAIQCSIPLAGAHIFSSIQMDGKPVAGPAQLVCVLQHGPSTDPELSPPRETFQGAVQHVTVEQSGPVRAVVKIEGMHRGAVSKREWLPFTIRLYFYAGQSDVRMVHTIVFDGDQEKDFVRGLGLAFEVPMREEPRNRTVRFAGPDGGLWSEPLQPGGGSIAQETGQPFPGNPIFLKNAIWDDFKLSQPTPHGFTIVKRTNPKSAWVFSNAGKRAPGLAFAGDLGGGLAVSVKNFWQSFPSGLEIRQASAPTAQLIAWLWSPDAPEMDMRFYDTHGHGLDASYEDVQPGLSTAYGVARTSELTLYPCSAWPSKADTVAVADSGQQHSLLACSPEYIHSAGVFGVWSVPDRSTAFKKSLEDGLDSVLAYYQRQIDDRSWYGFWQYGDFMHSYSYPRHVWHYDWGGHAWDNTELGAPLWLWYSYLRSGRADLFRLAEAHTRNTSETCVYHLGPMKGLGSRHNVIKWGDGAKEVRISQAAHWRFFYYLTTDERAGDIMQMVAESAGVAIGRYDPMREAAPWKPGEPHKRIRIGPDWFAIAGNWMTAWERTNDNRWRDLILAGVDSIVAMPYGLETGMPVANFKARAAIVGFDDETGKLTPIPDPATKEFGPANYNLATIQGGAEVMFELVPLLGRKDFETAWLRLCRIGNAPAEVWDKDKASGDEGADGRYVVPGQGGARLAAYAYAKTNNATFAQTAITRLLALGAGIATPHIVSGPDSLCPVEEDARVSTNDASQTGLETIEILELLPSQLLPSGPAVRTRREFRRRPRVAPSS
jgi:PcRGLX-like protein C-terminal alpha/alpha toroid domain/PcRGLX-like protein central beta sandwich domain/PcRGLX-like N-terminal RIFT barrel domain